MKRLAIIIALTVVAAAQAVSAQLRPGGPGGGSGGGANADEQRAERQPYRRDQMERRGQQGERGAPGSAPGGQRMTPEERRALRDQVRDHGRDIYRDPAKR